MSKSIEINCPGCGEETLLLRKPVYDGFTLVGEAFSCASCGHAFESEEDVPFKEQSRVEVFTEADRSSDPEVFEENEATICRHCANYTINPFTQWCALHKKEVEAIDSCPQFEQKQEEEKDAPI